MNDIALVSLFLRGSLPEMAESNAVSEIKAREEAFRQAEPQYDTVTAGATAERRPRRHQALSQGLCASRSAAAGAAISRIVPCQDAQGTYAAAIASMGAIPGARNPTPEISPCTQRS